MAERITVVVVPPRDGEDLTVEEAMRQVLTIFELLADPDERIVWRLVHATANSPLRVTAEAQPTRPDVLNADVIAREQRTKFTRNVRGIRQGNVLQDWEPDKVEKAVALYKRYPSIGRTIVVEAPDSPSIEINPDDAPSIYGPPVAPRAATKSQLGVIDGYLDSVGTHYRAPAIFVRDRLTARILPCVIRDEFRDQVNANFDDVWSGRRVFVHGNIEYRADGEVSRVFAEDVVPLDAAPVSVDDIQDKGFTGGLRAAEYLEKLRNGELDRRGKAKLRICEPKMPPPEEDPNANLDLFDGATG